MRLRVDHAEAINTILGLAAGKVSEEKLAGWIRTHTVRA
jgi:hypothetical protein